LTFPRAPSPSGLQAGGRPQLGLLSQANQAGQIGRYKGIALEVVRHTEAKRGFVLLPRRWVVERSFAWAARFRRLARDYERLPATLAGLHFVAFACLMLTRLPSIT